MKNTVIIKTITTRNGEVMRHSIEYVSPWQAWLRRFVWRFNRFLDYLYCKSGFRKLINRLASVQAT